MSSGNIPVRLRQLYDDALGVGAFPTGECRSIGLTDEQHGDLVVWLANIAGIASHGERLVTVSLERRCEFVRLTSESFLSQHPEFARLVTEEKTPTLSALLQKSEEARLLIQELFQTSERRDSLSG